MINSTPINIFLGKSVKDQIFYEFVMVFESTLKYFLIFLISIGFVGSIFATDSKIKLDEQFPIKMNQTMSLDNFKISFLEITEDSRCPSDVTCIWQGRASIKLNIEHENQNDKVIMSTGENSTATVEPYEINLIDIKPYPISTDVGTHKEYIAIIKISKNKEPIITPPLKQYKSGIDFKEIKCKHNLILVKKIDGTPACVTPEAKQKLIERGWGINES